MQCGLDPGTEKGHQWRSRISPNKVWILVNPPVIDEFLSLVKCTRVLSNVNVRKLGEGPAGTACTITATFL